MQGTFIKICGITNVSDGRAAVRAGANGLGFIFFPDPRRISKRTAADVAARVHPSVWKFGIFVNDEVPTILEHVDAVGLDAVQLQGSEPQELVRDLKLERPNLFVAKAVKVTSQDSIAEARAFWADAIFLDTMEVASPEKESGKIPEEWLKDCGIDRVIVAGGLSPENVHELVYRVRPWGVDVDSGVESAPGKKDPVRVAEFVQQVRRAELVL